MNVDFDLKALAWQKKFLCIFTVLGLCMLVLGVILYAVIDLHLAAFVILVSLGGFFFVVGGIGFYMSIVERFSLKDGMFEYIKPFKKNQRAKVGDVAKVVISHKASNSYGMSIYDVVLYDANGNKLINFYDDGGYIFRGKKFERALEYYKIPCIHK